MSIVNLVSKHSLEEQKNKGVYIIRNNVNGLFYVGSTCLSFRRRWLRHLNQLLTNKHPNPKLTEFYRNHGVDSLSFEIVLSTEDNNESGKVEQELLSSIEDFSTVFNVSRLVTRTRLGYEVGESTKQNLRNKFLGKPRPEWMAKAYGIKVGQYTLSGELVNTFDSYTDAQKETGVFRTSISLCVKGYNKHSGGFIWKKIEK